jgi:hypothetical protein
VKFGNKITTIDDYAFASTNIREIYIDAINPPQISAHTFEGVSNTTPVYVPCNSVNKYKNDSFWGKFKYITGNDVSINITLTGNAQMGTVRLLQAPCENDTAVIEAIPHRGYSFVAWEDGGTDNLRTVIVTGDSTFTAIFKTNMFLITVLSDDASKGSVSASGTYETGNTIAINAIANENYYFIQWNDGNMDNPRTIVVLGDSTFTATFSDHTERMARVSVFPHNPSMGEVSGSGYYDKNTIATIDATAYHGNRFVCWNDGNSDNPRTITVTQDIVFVASFERMTSIEDIETKHIVIYPNPATDNIHITLPENVHQALFILYDMQGKILIKQEVSNQDMVSINSLASGVYIYNVRTDKQSYQGKLIHKYINKLEIY